MGTPVKILEREMNCVGAGPCSQPRQLTEEEMLKYYTKEEIEEMKGKKIIPPAKEALLRTLAEVKGKTKAICHAAKAHAVSNQTVFNWVKDLGIEFDDSGMVISEDKANVVETMQEASLLTEITVPIDKLEPNVAEEEKAPANEAAEAPASKCKEVDIDETESTPLPFKAGYVEYDIDNALLQIDYRQKLVSINNGKDMTFAEAQAVADLLTEVL